MRNNRYRTVVFLSLLFIQFGLTTNRVFAQKEDLIEKFTQQYMQVRQKPLSEGLLRNYLAEAGIKEDTVYAVIYQPSYAPRCEYMINLFHKILKEEKPDAKLLLITAYNDSAAAAAYNRRKGYKADYYLYDQTQAYKGFLSFNYRDDMYGTYILKLSRKGGKMIVGGNADIISKEFAKQLTQFSNTLEAKTFAYKALDKAKTAAYANPLKDMRPIGKGFKEYCLYTREYPISSIYGTPIFENGNLLFNDQLASGIMMFSENGSSLEYKTIFRVDSVEGRRYIDLPEDLYQECRKGGSFFYIPRSPIMIDKETVAISYSVPHVFERPGEISFYNKPTVITRNINTLGKGKMYEINTSFMKSNYMCLHFSFDIFADYLLTGCQKQTWPMEYKREEYEHKVDMNPFDDGFYDTPNPIIAVFDTDDGNEKAHIGHLEPFQRKSRTGYYFYSNVITHHGDKLLYGNSMSGKLYIADKKDIKKEERSYTLFEIDAASFPKPDTTMFYKPTYGKAYAPFFSRNAECLKMNDGEIWAIVSNRQPSAEGNGIETTYAAVMIDRATGNRTERLLPEFKEQQLMGWGLSRDEEKINPFAVLKQDGKCTVRVYTEL